MSGNGQNCPFLDNRTNVTNMTNSEEQWCQPTVMPTCNRCGATLQEGWTPCMSLPQQENRGGHKPRELTNSPTHGKSRANRAYYQVPSALWGWIYYTTNKRVRLGKVWDCSVCMCMCRRYRYTAYRQLVRWCWGWLGRDIRVVLATSETHFLPEITQVFSIQLFKNYRLAWHCMKNTVQDNQNLLWYLLMASSLTGWSKELHNGAGGSGTLGSEGLVLPSTIFNSSENNSDT